MTPLPFGGHAKELVAWRLDTTAYSGSWDSGEGARLFGGRWNSRGRTVVYCCVDPATAILEVAVHKGFRILDTVPHVLTESVVADATRARIVMPGEVPNPNWLRPGDPSAGQQGFGDALLAAHPFVLIPSVVSTRSWNLIFDPSLARGLYTKKAQGPFALDPRLHPPQP